MEPLKSLKDFISQVKKDYTYTIKIAAPSMPEQSINQIEDELKKYNLQEFGGFKESLIQENPLDFPTARNVRVYTADVTVQYPFTIDTIERVISQAASIPRGYVVVYSEKDPRKQYTQEYLERNSPDFQENYKPLLGSEDPEVNHDDLYGEKYNEKFLKGELEKRKKQESYVITDDKLFPGLKVDKSTHVDTGLGPIETDSPVGSKKIKIIKTK
jgi:hypothetical protein